MRERFVVRPRESIPNDDQHMYVTLRVKCGLVEEFDKLAGKSGHSRNKLMNMALEYALRYLEYDDATSDQK